MKQPALNHTAGCIDHLYSGSFDFPLSNAHARVTAERLSGCTADDIAPLSMDAETGDASATRPDLNQQAQ